MMPVISSRVLWRRRRERSSRTFSRVSGERFLTPCTDNKADVLSLVSAALLPSLLHKNCSHLPLSVLVVDARLDGRRLSVQTHVDDVARLLPARSSLHSLSHLLLEHVDVANVADGELFETEEEGVGARELWMSATQLKSSSSITSDSQLEACDEVGDGCRTR